MVVIIAICVITMGILAIVFFRGKRAKEAAHEHKSIELFVVKNAVYTKRALPAAAAARASSATTKKPRQAPPRRGSGAAATKPVEAWGFGPDGTYDTVEPDLGATLDDVDYAVPPPATPRNGPIRNPVGSVASRGGYIDVDDTGPTDPTPEGELEYEIPVSHADTNDMC
jgi:hypothetical protein